MVEGCSCVRRYPCVEVWWGGGGVGGHTLLDQPAIYAEAALCFKSCRSMVSSLFCVAHLRTFQRPLFMLLQLFPHFLKKCVQTMTALYKKNCGKVERQVHVIGHNFAEKCSIELVYVAAASQTTQQCECRNVFSLPLTFIFLRNYFWQKLASFRNGQLFFETRTQFLFNFFNLVRV